jgi:hypothetical protein
VVLAFVIVQPVRLCLSASHSTVFFSHNKSASAKTSQPETIQRTGWLTTSRGGADAALTFVVVDDFTRRGGASSSVIISQLKNPKVDWHIG